MKKVSIYILCLLLLIICAGCSFTNKQVQTENKNPKEYNGPEIKEIIKFENLPTNFEYYESSGIFNGDMLKISTEFGIYEIDYKNNPVNTINDYTLILEEYKNNLTSTGSLVHTEINDYALDAIETIKVDGHTGYILSIPGFDENNKTKKVEYLECHFKYKDSVFTLYSNLPRDEKNEKDFKMILSCIKFV